MTETSPTPWCFEASDGYQLVCHHWKPSAGTATKARIVILHGIQSHAGWYQNLGHILSRSGIEVLMPDRRGSGSNLTDRGHTTSSRRLIKDITEICDRWNQTSDLGLKPYLAGISWGGKLACATVASRPDLFQGLILIAPGLFAKVRPTFLTQIKILICAIMFPRTKFEIPLSDPKLFTEQKVWQEFISSDKQTLRKATARFFVASRMLDLRLKRIAQKVVIPVYLQLAELDRIVNNERITKYCHEFATKRITVKTYPNSHHTLEFEPDPIRNDYAEDIARWISS